MLGGREVDLCGPRGHRSKKTGGATKGRCRKRSRDEGREVRSSPGLGDAEEPWSIRSQSKPKQGRSGCPRRKSAVADGGDNENIVTGLRSIRPIFVES